MTTAKAKRNPATAAAMHADYLARIKGQLAALQAHAEAVASMTDVNYGHVGDLVHMSTRLQDLVDSVEKTGEYAA